MTLDSKDSRRGVKWYIAHPLLIDILTLPFAAVAIAAATISGQLISESYLMVFTLPGPSAVLFFSALSISLYFWMTRYKYAIYAICMGTFLLIGLAVETGFGARAHIDGYGGYWSLDADSPAGRDYGVAKWRGWAQVWIVMMVFLLVLYAAQVMTNALRIMRRKKHSNESNEMLTLNMAPAHST